MKRVACLVVGLVCAGAQAANPPFQPIAVTDYQDNDHRRGLLRLKITLASDILASMPPVRLGGVVVCSDRACYRPPPFSSVKAVLDGGEVAVVADMSLPPGVIRHLYIEPLRGGNVMAGGLTLATPLKLEKGFYGGEIFATVRSTRTGADYVHQPLAATAAPIHPEVKLWHGRPGFPILAKLAHGVVLDIPAGALPGPVLLAAVAHDTGDAYPLVDVYPYMDLAKSASLTVPPLPRRPLGRLAPAVALPPVTSGVVAPGAMPQRGSGPVINKTFSTTRLFRFGAE